MGNRYVPPYVVFRAQLQGPQDVADYPDPNFDAAVGLRVLRNWCFSTRLLRVLAFDLYRFQAHSNQGL